MGWALKQSRSRNTRFTDKQKDYLIAKFQTGEQTGQKADAASVSRLMRGGKTEKQFSPNFQRDHHAYMSVHGLFKQEAMFWTDLHLFILNQSDTKQKRYGQLVTNLYLRLRLRQKCMISLPSAQRHPF